MELAIKVDRLQDQTYMASVDWSKGDASTSVIGVPGAVRYADTPEKAYECFEELLKSKQHTVIGSMAEALNAEPMADNGFKPEMYGKLKGQVCTLAQAIQLKGLGVSQNSLFYYFPNEDVVNGQFMDLGMLHNPSERAVSAFTTGELAMAAPTSIVFNKTEIARLRIDKYGRYWTCSYKRNYSGGELAIGDGESPVEAFANILILLVKKGYLSANELSLLLK